MLIVIASLSIFFSGLRAENLGKLKGILDPTNIEISDGEVYIVQGATIHVFSLPQIQPVRILGGEGEGPGELKVTPWLSNTMSIFPRHIVFGSVDKFISFAKDGRLLQEQRLNPVFTQVIPFEDVQVVRKRIMERDIQYSTINIFHPEYKSLKELYRQKFAGRRGEADAIPDSIHFTVYDNQLYIEQSAEGFVMKSFDKNGNLLSTFNPPFKPVRLTEKDRARALQTMKEDPLINLNPGGWNNYLRTTRLKFPSHFPPIREFVIIPGKIIVQTFHIRGEEEEYIILSRDGKIEKRLFLPLSEKPGFTEEMMGTGVKYFAFTKEHYYRIRIKDDWCELERIPVHMEKNGTK